jgi:hypothetical protein
MVEPAAAEYRQRRKCEREPPAAARHWYSRAVVAARPHVRRRRDTGAGSSEPRGERVLPKSCPSAQRIVTPAVCHALLLVRNSARERGLRIPDGPACDVLSRRSGSARRGSAPRSSNREETPIRTLSVSLVAVAAIAASLLLTRKPQGRDPVEVPAGERLPAEQSLDAIRAAGL